MSRSRPRNSLRLLPFPYPGRKTTRKQLHAGWEQNDSRTCALPKACKIPTQHMVNPAKLQEELEGYCGLGMYDEALRRITQARRKGDHSLTLAFLRTRILRAAGRFVELKKTAEQLRRQRPEEPEVWVSLADAVRHQDSLQQGRSILLEAERKFPDNPHIKFQLGCYHCQLRDLDKARSYLQAAIRLDESWATVAKEDADLAPLREKS